MNQTKLSYVFGGALVVGFAAVSILSYNSLRTDVNRMSEVMFFSAIKDSTDKTVLATYFERYPDGMFAKAVQARVDEVARGGTMIAMAGIATAGANPGAMADMQAAVDEVQKKAQAEADKLIADARAEAKKTQELAQATLAKAEAAKAETAKLQLAKAEADKAAANAKAEAEKIATSTLAKVEQAQLAQTKAEQAQPAPAPKPQVAAIAPAAQAKTTVAKTSAPSGSAAFIVISSTADGLKKGDKVGSGDPIVVPAGERVVLMNGDGKVINVRGPFNGAPRGGEVSGLIARLSDALGSQPDAPRRVGAFRSITPVRQADPVSPWTIDVTASGDWCVATDQAVTLTGAGNTGGNITIDSGGQKTDVAWPKGQATVTWPAGIQATNDATYQIRVNGNTTAIKLHVLDRKVNPGLTALWMAGQGCQRQAAAMIDRLELDEAGSKPAQKS